MTILLVVVICAHPELKKRKKESTTHFLHLSVYIQATIAASHGMIGLLLYPDPIDMTFDMPMTYVMTPDLSGMMGDPLTPGCPSVGMRTIFIPFLHMIVTV